MSSSLTQLVSGSFPTDRTEFFCSHMRPNGAPWSFERHEYLQAIVADDAAQLVLRKAAQLGLSTIMIGRSLYDAVRGRKVGYYLTDRSFMEAFVQDRFDPLINADQHLSQATEEGKTFGGAEVSARARRKQADNLRIKHVANGTIWFQGLQSLKDAKSIDLDALVMDELDELDPELLPWVDDRLLHSEYKRKVSLSQPGVPNYGIDAEFQAGDQRYWMIRCGRCRRWCNLIDDWPDCLVLHAEGDWRIVCRKCGARVVPVQSDRCEWVAKEPGREVHSYALSQLYGPFCTPADVAARQQKAQKSASAMHSLMVSIVGLPWAGDRQPINDDVLAGICGDWAAGLPDVLSGVVPAVQRDRSLRVAGIDTGDVLHVAAAEQTVEGDLLVYDAAVISGPDQWDALARWLLAHDVHFFCIDAQPYATNSKALCRVPGLNGAICYFNAQSLQTGLQEEGAQIPIKVVKHDRTEAIDELADEMRARDLLLPLQRLDIVGEIKRHCKALVKDLGPDGRYRYKKNVENHFGLALTYLVLARRVAELLRIGPPVPLGPAHEIVSGKPRQSW